MHTRADASLSSPLTPPTAADADQDSDDDDWSPIRGSESPHHLKWKERVADAKGINAEDRVANLFPYEKTSKTCLLRIVGDLAMIL